MLFAYERGEILMSTFSGVFFSLLATLFLYTNPKIKQHKTWGNFYTWYVEGLAAPCVAIFFFLILGALALEALEATAEEDGNPKFVRCLEHFPRGECREWKPRALDDSAENLARIELLGEPEFPWRNWDFFGGLFFSFTIVTTIGYGTFGPASAGGKLFVCGYMLVGIPLAAAKMTNVAQAMVHIFFHEQVRQRWLAVRAALGSYDDLDADRSGSVSLEEVEAALRRAALPLRRDEVEAMVAACDTDGEKGLSQAEFERLLDRIADWAGSRREALPARALG